ncbi:uncharacterized protein LOC131952450 [Physella acuta]|uniref:uncharacterized protein LOC131952450 n=1 Tax=Physella acuta TaxID=109671 RepID=UPI0027DCEFE9|nr:uncharacterized protein LOC131952450 [Physella acuta]
MAAMPELKRFLVPLVLLLLSCDTNGQETPTTTLITTSPTTPTTTPTSVISTTTRTTAITSTTPMYIPENCLRCENVCNNPQACYFKCLANCPDGYFLLTGHSECLVKQDTTNETTTVFTNETTSASNETTAATITTTIPKVYCKHCNIENCKHCELVNRVRNCTECVAGSLLVNNTCRPTPAEDKASIVGPVVGGVVGGLVVVVVIIVIIICVCKRRRRQDLHTSSSGLENLTLDQSTSSPSLTKIDEESIQRAHDQITRYTRDPTEKHPTPPSPASIGASQRSESKDLDELPIAPPPPTGGESYDALAFPSPTNPVSYSPVPMRRDLPADDTYANTASILQQINATDSIYANTADPEPENYEFPSSAIANTPRMRSDVPPQQETASMCDDQEIYMNEDANGTDQQEIYSNETVNHEEDQEIYANQEFEGGEEIYLNQPVGK